jgi:hypothetical protein
MHLVKIFARHGHAISAHLPTADAEVACFGHGEPLTGDAAAVLAAAAQSLPD